MDETTSRGNSRATVVSTKGVIISDTHQARNELDLIQPITGAGLLLREV
jgi:hypothetical protein